MASDYTKWTVDDVATWLSQIHLSHLVPTFEMHGITGSTLLQLDEQFIKDRLRMSNPSEILALRGAISNLQDLATSTSALPGSTNRRPSEQVSMMPLPSTAERVRTRSFDKNTWGESNFGPSSSTLPYNKKAQIVRNQTVPPTSVGYRKPVLSQGSAQELLEDCRHCGWIIKQGGGYKSWKRRYLILRKGCLYYFANETASAPKGSFALTGYTTETCKEQEITKKYKNIIKLTPINPHIRTYYIAVGSKKELNTWKNVIDEEINAVTTRLPSNSRVGNGTASIASGGGVGSAGLVPLYTPAEDDDNEDEGNKIYEDMGENDKHTYDIPEDATENIYERPPNESSSDEDDPYSKIEIDLSPSHIFLPDGKPVVPQRSVVSLQDTASHGIPTNTINVPIVSAADAHSGDEDTYLPIIGSGPATNLAACLPGTSMESPKSPPHEEQEPVAAKADNGDYEDDENLEFSSNEDGDVDDDESAYYIMIPKADELMPKECVFDSLDRADADRLLRSKNRDGTYLIRAGSHAGADKVLSVWHIDRCRHFKLFKSSNGKFSLTQGQTFRTIPELLQYYSLQSHLPRSDFYLGDPYNPLDH